MGDSLETVYAVRGSAPGRPAHVQREGRGLAGCSGRDSQVNDKTKALRVPSRYRLEGYIPQHHEVDTTSDKFRRTIVLILADFIDREFCYNIPASCTVFF